MREELQNRLDILRKEFEAGQGRLRDLEMQEAHLRGTMLRISGAIQVLEELLAGAKPGEDERQ
jgi:predicted nuclease with TOPRIM domain